MFELGPKVLLAALTMSAVWPQGSRQRNASGLSTGRFSPLDAGTGLGFRVNVGEAQGLRKVEGAD